MVKETEQRKTAGEERILTPEEKQDILGKTIGLAKTDSGFAQALEEETGISVKPETIEDLAQRLYPAGDRYDAKTACTILRFGLQHEDAFSEQRDSFRPKE